MYTPYKNVYFRIDSSYKFGEGWDESQSKEFETEVTRIFTGDNWTIRKSASSGVCLTVTKDKESLYLHPMNFSGAIKADNIKHIEGLLKAAVCFKCRGIDIYEDVFDITDKQYEEYLASEREIIKQTILDTFVTKRSNLYHGFYQNILNNISHKFRLKRIEQRESYLEYDFTERVFNQLAKEGKLISSNTKNGIGYRTANKKELKQLKEASI